MASQKSVEFGDPLVEVFECGFQGFAVIRVGGRLQVVHNSRSRELQVLALLIALDLFGGLRSFS